MPFSLCDRFLGWRSPEPHFDPQTAKHPNESPSCSTVVPNEPTHPVQGERRGSVGLAHHFKCNWVLPTPVEPVAAVYREPSHKKHQRPFSPLAFNHDTHGPRRRRIGNQSHDQADWDIPIRRLVVEAPGNE